MLTKRTIMFTVAGRPATAGSKRAFPFKRKDGKLGVSVAPDNQRSKAWMAIVHGAASEAMGEEPLMHGPVLVVMTFCLRRPKSHYGTGRNADKLKASAPDYPTGKPDITKLVRCVEDALKGVVWADDSQVVRQSVEKVYSAHWEGVEVMISEEAV